MHYDTDSYHSKYQTTGSNDLYAESCMPNINKRKRV